MDLTKSIRPGLSAMPGTDENRGSARHVAMGFCRRFGDFNLFITISPFTGGTHVISFNSTKLEDRRHVDFEIQLKSVGERKRTAGENPYQSAMYASRIVDAFVEYFLGWDSNLKAPKKFISEDGIISSEAMGVVESFCSAAENQKNGDIHFHFVVRIRGFPRTANELEELLHDKDFKKR